MRRGFALLLCFLAFSLILTSCGGGSGGASITRSLPQTTGTVYVTGSDAPLPAVVSFQVDITSLALSDGTNTVQLLTETQTIEFSRLLGLRTLLALNSVPTGTYTSATVKLANPKISYLNTNANPVTVSVLNGTLTTDTLNINFNRGLTVTDGGLGALHFHLNIRDSLRVDGTGQLTGVVNPVIQMRPLTLDDDDAEIDELRGGLSTVNTGAGTFVVQRPRGRDITVVTNAQTQFDLGESISTLSAPAVLEIAGKIRADGALLASRVHILSRDRGFIAGLVLDPIPATGDATSVNMLVREEIPDLAGIEPGKPSVINIAANTVFDIYRFDAPIETLIFNPSRLVRGQRLTIGGQIDTNGALLTKRIVLHRQGHEGIYKPGSLNVIAGNTGTFQLNLGGPFGYLMGNQLTIQTGPQTRFRGVAGLNGIANAGDKPVCVVGLLLKDNNGNPVFYAAIVAVDRERLMQ